ncbi:RHS repeat-associated core domain-containing protein, partial [Flavobacterium sp.]
NKSISLDLSLTYNIVNSTGTVYGIQCWNWLQINAASVANAQKYKPTFYEGDFNGDTISEILIKKPSNSITITNNPPTDPITLTNPPFNSELCNFSISRGAETYYLVNLDPNTGSTLGTTGFKSISDTFNCLNNITLLADFNGDNKSDILSIRPDKSYVICEIIQTNNYGYTSIIAQGSIPLYSTDRLLLTGDFNGDGKTDLIFSNMVGSGCEDQSYCNDWTIYFCNPKLNFGEAFEASQYDIVHYMPVRNYSLSTITNSYYVMDTNKDGKSDIVRIERVFYKPLWTINNHDTRWTVSSYVNNIGNQLNNGFQLDYHSPTNHDYDNNWFPIPIVSSFRNKGLSYDLVMVQEQNISLTFIKFTKDFTRDNLLSKVTQSNGGIVDEIFYSQMQPNLIGPDNGLGTDFYSNTNTLQHPYIEVSRNPFSRLVFKLKNTAVGFTRYQDFKYRGYVIKIDGVGSLGFTKTARSAWYNEQTPSKTWYTTENNPQLRGATIRQTTLQLPSTTELDLSNIPTTNLISKVENTYVESAAGVFPYSILLNTQTTTDYLSGVIKKTEYLEYTTDYLLPRQVKSSNYLGTVLHGESLQVVDFENSVANGSYFIGRPTQKSITNKVYVNTLTGSIDTKSSLEKYFYDSKGNITKIETTKNSDPLIVINENDYYPNGLLWKTRIKNSGFTPLSWDTSNGVRETIYTYDSSNRFVKTEQDPLGVLKTNNSFHPIYGLVLSSTNSTLNLTQTNEYDNWGKLITTTSPLGVKEVNSYSRNNNIFTTSKTIQNSSFVSDGSQMITEQNVLAQVIRKGQKDINGNWIYIKSEYDYLGRLYRSSEPYFGTSSPTKWNYTYYDDFSRPISKVSYTNRVINMSYNGLTATSTDVSLGLTKTKTTNANGVVVTAVDNPGGTIVSRYDANGNLVESLYEGISTKIVYDNWGRKISLDDPSSDSLYEYKYNAYGETIYEKSPKGETKLIMSPVGLLNQKIETGDNTNITSTYSYDSINKLLNSTSIINTNVSANPSVYTNFYDSLKRIYKTVEVLQLPGNVSSTFTNESTFDSFSRVNSEKNTTVIHNQTSVKNISFTYQNGYKKQVKDGNLILWEVNSTDENLNLLSANLGNGIQLTNTFDQFGYLEENKLQSSNINISNRTNFEPILGNLTTRFSGFFNVNDNFTYDNLDRLSSWEESGINTLKFYFNSSLEGFVPVGNAILVLENNPQNVLDKRLKVTTSALNTGVYKTIISQGIAQQKFRISGYFSFVNGNSEIKLKLIESNQTGVVNEIDIPLEQNSIFNFDYTLQSNSEVHLYFTQGNLNVLSPFIENPSNIFLLDNLEVSEYELYSQTYDSKGRIQSNASANYSYSASKPYRNISIYGENFLKGAPSNVYQTNVTYNANRQPVTITNSIENVNLYYNGYGQRCAMIWGNANVDPLTRNQRRYYSADGNVEVNTFYATGATTPNKVEIITYLDGSAYTAIALNKTIVDLNINTTTNDIYYLHRDYQGTINAITNANGAIVERRLFDVWGHLKRVEDGNGNTLSKLTFIERGYTGHEHLSSSELINMNARLYSPLYHRFLSPDLVIQDPFNTQNYNRYSYCVNNPTKYTDITGNVFGVDDAILIAVAVAAVTYTLNAAMNDIPFTYQGLVTNMAISAFSAAVTFGIGEVASQIGNFWVRSSFQAFAHGSFRGTMTGIQGGNFWASFSAAAISSIASSAWSGGYTFDSQGAVTEVFYHPGIKDILGLNGTFFSHAFATVSGGFSSKLAKGNFWQGAVIAFSVSMFNHYFHNEGDNDEHKVQYAKYDSDKNAEKLIYFKKSGKDRDLFKSAKSEELIAGVLTIYGHGNVQSFNYSGLNVDYVKN